MFNPRWKACAFCKRSGTPDARRNIPDPPRSPAQKRSRNMKAKFRSIIFVAAMGIAFPLSYPWAASGARVVSAPPPMMQVPGSYVWDGRQFVGTVGNRYYYVGPGNVWMPMDQSRRSRFSVWENGHPNWQSHATPNVRYRSIRQGPTQPVVVVPPPPGTRSGGGRPRPRPRSSRSNPNTNPYMIPRLKQSPGGPAYNW